LRKKEINKERGREGEREREKEKLCDILPKSMETVAMATAVQVAIKVRCVQP